MKKMDKHELILNSFEHRVANLKDIDNIVWMIIISIMVLLAQVGFLMKEIGSIKIKRNNTIMLKTVLVVAISSFTFFFVGYGICNSADGGLMGQNNFVGQNMTSEDWLKFVFDLSLCIMMASIATGALGERIYMDTYIFFSFVNSGLIFPIGQAWCWNDGWLQNLGFIDYGGASIVHLIGGFAGFIGTILIGPRIGIFKDDQRMAFVLQDEYLDSDEVNFLLSMVGDIN